MRPLRHRSVLATLALLSALGVATTLPPAQAGQAAPACSAPVLTDPLAVAAGRTGWDVAELREQAALDDRLVVDRCGFVYFQEARAAQGPPTGRLTRAGLPAPLARTFDLESRPGSDRTIYLHFRGGTLTDTAFNADFALPTLTLSPFSLTSPVSTKFSAYERGEIQRAWQVVAEDYAPFDVNVTTRAPEPGALDRVSAEDTRYGVTAVATGGGGPIQRACGCGGLAYGNVFGVIGADRDYRQPALVFGGFTGESIGENLSHEIGHLFGLYHDGNASGPYHEGHAPWAPIMGSGFSQPVTQWSQGEYAGATNTQDDLAVIATNAPLRLDDHGDSPESATPLESRVPTTGVITSRTDVDAFAFTARGRVRLRASVLANKANLDLGLTVFDARGRVMATVSPATSRASSGRAAGLGATWQRRVRRTGTFTVVLDGVGDGDPGRGGIYTDYASLGRYQVLLTVD